MKNSFVILLICALTLSGKLVAQSHATVNKLEVSYKAVSQGTANSLANIQCIPMATITLQSNANVNKVYFKVIDPQTNAVVYNVNYVLSTSTLSNQNGFKLFEVNDDKVYISNGEQLTLKPYLYEIKTENSQNTISASYTTTK